MNLHSQSIISNIKAMNFISLSPFLTGIAGVGLGILVGFYLGLL